MADKPIISSITSLYWIFCCWALLKSDAPWDVPYKVRQEMALQDLL